MDEKDLITVAASELKLGDMIYPDIAEVVKIKRDKEWFPTKITVTTLVEDEFVKCGVVAERMILEADMMIQVWR